ncbi:hypothetical protein FDECE_14150 [Fusarium decemcellulare]|nr:hypothetical protein FDECE_14150 [Fusarium decemcellulare]
MDGFSSLPPEIRLEILLFLKTRSNILPLLRASPTMLAQYCESKKHIRRAFLRAELDGSVLQDALGRHIERWSLAQFREPFRHNDHDIVECLDRLYDRLSTYIEDYITKASSEYPPRAYMGLPDLPSPRGVLGFRNNAIGINVIKMDDLSDAERRRLFQAFVRYDLLCKMSYIRAMWYDSDPHNTLDSTVDSKFEFWENEAIQCVHRYVQDLYGAVFAHSVDSWLPEIPDTLLTEPSEKIVDDGLLFPDNVSFWPDAYMWPH